MNRNRILALSLKECYHIARDPFTIALALIIPILMVFIFGTAIEFRPVKVPLFVDDRDHSKESRDLLLWAERSEAFRFIISPPLKNVLLPLENELAKGVLTIDHHKQGVTFDLDGADNTTISSLLASMMDLEFEYNKTLLRGGGLLQASPVKTTFLYNPELNTPYFIIPGLMVVVLAIIAIMLTALSIAKDFENGSMELLLTTPLTPLEIIIGKILPYLGLSLLALLFIYLTGRFIFDLPFKGSHFLLLISSLLFLGAYLTQGIVISIVTKKQVLSMQFAMMSGLLPSLLLSGLIFPNENMPLFFYYLTMLLPARWFMIMTRSLFLMDPTFLDLFEPFLALFLMNIVLMMVAKKKFKRSLE